jgi:hypothetical protein
MENSSEGGNLADSHVSEHAEHHKHGHHRHQRHVEVVVNGKQTKVEYTEHEHGRVLVEKALKQTHNTGQEPDKWELRNEKGEKLDQSKRVEEYHLHEGQKLFLNQQAGGGGAGAELR